jgi:hypothetical protein
MIAAASLDRIVDSSFRVKGFLRFSRDLALRISDQLLCMQFKGSGILSNVRCGVNRLLDFFWDDADSEFCGKPGMLTVPACHQLRSVKPADRVRKIQPGGFEVALHA